MDVMKRDPHTLLKVKVTLLMGYKLVKPLWKTVWILLKTNKNLPYDLAISLWLFIQKAYKKQED